MIIGAMQPHFMPGIGYFALMKNVDQFVILDDVELFNINSLNALLKVIEEPGKNNYFILINNQTKPILATIKSRCLEIKLIVSDNEKKQITETLLKYFNLEEALNRSLITVSPGIFLRINHFFVEKKINIEDDPISNLSKILIDTVEFLGTSLFIGSISFSLFTPNNLSLSLSIATPGSFDIDKIGKFLFLSSL